MRHATADITGQKPPPSRSDTFHSHSTTESTAPYTDRARREHPVRTAHENHGPRRLKSRPHTEGHPSHVLEAMTDQRYIRARLGHTGTKITESYAKMPITALSPIKSPLDDWYARFS